MSETNVYHEKQDDEETVYHVPIAFLSLQSCGITLVSERDSLHAFRLCQDNIELNLLLKNFLCLGYKNAFTQIVNHYILGLNHLLDHSISLIVIVYIVVVMVLRDSLASVRSSP